MTLQFAIGDEFERPVRGWMGWTTMWFSMRRTTTNTTTSMTTRNAALYSNVAVRDLYISAMGAISIIVK